MNYSATSWIYSHSVAEVQPKKFPHLSVDQDVYVCFFPEVNNERVPVVDGYSFFHDENGRWVLRALSGGPVTTQWGKVNGFAVWTPWKEGEARG